MIALPSFGSTPEYVRHLGDVELWRPHVEAALESHGLPAGMDLEAGFNPTYPTFLAGDSVVKLFGHLPAWGRSHAAESAAHGLLATDPGIAAPRVLASGSLAGDAGAPAPEPWPYLVTTRMHGVAWQRAELSVEARHALAAQLGKQVRRVHALPTSATEHVEWPAQDVTGAARRSSLPAHLVAQVTDFLARLEPGDRVFVHGDLCATHAFVEDGRLTGIIDWGDAMVTDRHYELIQIHRDTFSCDKALLRTFLDASDWPAGRHFARQALGHALHRQALGLAQHHTMDVFEPVARLLPLEDIATLDELATELFCV